MGYMTEVHLAGRKELQWSKLSLLNSYHLPVLTLAHNVEEQFYQLTVAYKCFLHILSQGIREAHGMRVNYSSLHQ